MAMNPPKFKGSINVMKTHTVELSERDLEVVLGAMMYARENGPRWWVDTLYVSKLYDRLVEIESNK